MREMDMKVMKTNNFKAISSIRNWRNCLLLMLIGKVFITGKNQHRDLNASHCDIFERQMTKSNYSRKIEETLIRLQFTAIFQCSINKRQSDMNQKGSTRVTKTLRSSFWRMPISIHSLITFRRPGIERIWPFSRGETISETEMDDQWVMWPITESFQQKISRVLLQNSLSQPLRQLTAKTMHKCENLGLRGIESCVFVLSWFLSLFKLVTCQRFHSNNHCQPIHSSSIHDYSKLNEK
jgi:hypothetical protein